MNASSRRPRWVSALCAFLLLAVLPPAGLAPAQDDVEEIGQRQLELEALKSQIEANRRQLERLGRQETDLTAVARGLEKDRKLTQRYLDRLAEQEGALRADLADRQAELLAKEVEAEAAAKDLKKRLIQYYKLRHVTGAELFLSSRSFDELFARGQYLGRLIHRERADLLGLSQDRAQIAGEAARIGSRRRAIAALQAEKRSEERRLAGEQRQTREALAALRNERAANQTRIEELESSQAAIRKMIAALEKARERRKRREPTGSSDAGFARLRGTLPWPVRGSVIAEFGFEIHPKYRTKVPMNGIVIRAEAGTPIHAVAGGVVEFVDWLPGYGRTVILDHGGGFYSLYAHAATISVGRGQRVAAGEEIARVGDTDSLWGPALHFELRRGPKALDPRDWLQ